MHHEVLDMNVNQFLLYVKVLGVKYFGRGHNVLSQAVQQLWSLFE